MDGKIFKITNEMEQLHCYILFEEVKEKVRRLKSYGIDDELIETLLHDEEIFPRGLVLHLASDVLNIYIAAFRNSTIAEQTKHIWWQG